MQAYLNTAVKAAVSAGDFILNSFQRLDLIKITEKGNKDFVTNVDKESEKIIIDIIKTSYPDHSILSEESGSIAGNEYKWIIDPLDGTMNFLHGYPHFCISIALEINDKTEIGVIYDPVRDDIYTAIKGNGSQKNNKKIRVGNVSKISESLIGTSFSIKSANLFDLYINFIKKVTVDSHSIRKSGSAALDLAHIASSQLDGFFALGLSKWDVAAGMIIIKESGGLTTGIYGEENFLISGNLISGNFKICKGLLKIINSIN